MNTTSNITFRNYHFEEQNDKLIISKNQNLKPIDFLKLIQKETCSHLLENYQWYLEQKQKDLSQFHPRFVSIDASQAFKHWHEGQMTQIAQKLKNPLEALQRKVAKRCDQLFQEKGQRAVLLGCCHVKTDVLRQTHTSFTGPEPQSTLKEEDHAHNHYVCLDWKVDAQEQIEFDLDGHAIAMPSFPDISANGPDFSRRWFEFSENMQDFAFLKKVQHVYAERVPLLERGVYKDSVSLLKQILDWLSPGGTFSFDLGMTIYLSTPKYPLNFDQACATLALINMSSERMQEIGKAKETEVLKDQEYLKFLNFVMNNLVQIEEGSPEEVASDIAKKEITRRLKLEVERDFYETQRKRAKEFTQENPDKVTLQPENIEMIFFGNENLPTLKFSLQDVRDGSAKEAIQACYEREPKRIERMRVRLQDDQEMPFEQLFAIYRQIECYNALHVNPQLNEELLPQNKKLLDEMLDILGGVICHHLKEFGFVNPKFDVNIPHPENKRLFSRLITVQKPM